MTKIVKLREAGGTDPARAALKEALGELEAARAARDRQIAGITKARQLVREAEAALKRAGEEIVKARAAHAEQIADAARGGDMPATGLLRKARAHERDCEDDLESARVAHERLRDGLPALEEALLDAGSEVECAISEVLAVPARALLERAAALRAQLRPTVILVQQLAAIGSRSGMAISWQDIVRNGKQEKALEEVRSAAVSFGDGRVSAAENVPVAANPWEEARRLLRENPDAPLPEALKG